MTNFEDVPSAYSNNSQGESGCEINPEPGADAQRSIPCLEVEKIHAQ